MKKREKEKQQLLGVEFLVSFLVMSLVSRGPEADT
jgi:hypothetical protein